MTMPAPTQRLCTCRCPTHHGYRRTFDSSGCACAITCPTQPMTLLAPQWSGALFTHPDTGALWYVMALGNGQWDWESAGEIDTRSDYFHAGRAIEDRLHTIAAILTNPPTHREGGS